MFTLFRTRFDIDVSTIFCQWEPKRPERTGSPMSIDVTFEKTSMHDMSGYESNIAFAITFPTETSTGWSWIVATDALLKGFRMLQRTGIIAVKCFGSFLPKLAIIGHVPTDRKTNRRTKNNIFVNLCNVQLQCGAPTKNLYIENCLALVIAQE